MNKYLMLFFLSVLFTHCTNISENDMQGKWHVVNVYFPNNIENSNTKNLRQELESMVFDFKSDGLLLHSDLFRTGAHGSWHLVNSGDSLICSYVFKREHITDKYKMSQTTDNSIVLFTDGFNTIEGMNGTELTIKK